MKKYIYKSKINYANFGDFPSIFGVWERTGVSETREQCVLCKICSSITKQVRELFSLLATWILLFYFFFFAFFFFSLSWFCVLSSFSLRVLSYFISFMFLLFCVPLLVLFFFVLLLHCLWFSFCLSVVFLL